MVNISFCFFRRNSAATYVCHLRFGGGPLAVYLPLATIYVYWSEGFAITGYDIPGCVEDGAWMLWEDSSVAVAVVVAHLGLGRGQLSVLLRLRRFRDARIGPARQASADGPDTTKSCRMKAQNIKQQSEKKT